LANIRNRPDLQRGHGRSEELEQVNGREQELQHQVTTV